jgi:hypothetical protein
MNCAVHARRRPRMAESLARAGKPGRTSFTSGNREPSALLEPASAGSGDAPEPGGALIAALLGTASAGFGSSTPRKLACGDAVYGGEQLTTAPDARLGVLSGEVYTQLESDTALKVNRTRGGGLDVNLEKGRVRVVDPRSTGPVGRLAIADTAAELRGSDADAHFVPSEQLSVIFPNNGTLDVVQGGTRTTVAKGGGFDVSTASPIRSAAATPKPVALPASVAVAVATVVETTVAVATADRPRSRGPRR